MDSPRIPSQARRLLQDELVSDDVIDVAECILGHMVDAAEIVGREYDIKAGDDPNLAGFNVARRGKNMAALELRDWERPNIVVRQAPGFTWDIRVGDTRLHTYSAPYGLDAFQLAGSERKAAIVDRCQKQLSLFEAQGGKSAPEDLVLAYERDRQGVARAVLGVLNAEDQFEWQVPIYGIGLAVAESRDDDGDSASPGFRDQPEEKPDISLKRRDERRDNLDG